VSTIFREAQLQAFRSYMGAALRGENVEEFEILPNLHRHGFERYSTKLFDVRDASGTA